jgi:hypothetical protein
MRDAERDGERDNERDSERDADYRYRTATGLVTGPLPDCRRSNLCILCDLA